MERVHLWQSWELREVCHFGHAYETPDNFFSSCFWTWGGGKVQWELLCFSLPLSMEKIKETISSVFVRINDRRKLICFILWEKHKYYKSEDNSVDLCSKNMIWHNPGECTGTGEMPEYSCYIDWSSVLDSQMIQVCQMFHQFPLFEKRNQNHHVWCLAYGSSSFR